MTLPYRRGGMIAASLAALLACTAASAQTLPTPEHIASLKVVGDPQISRDGAWIAYTLATPQREGKPPRSQIWRVPAQGQQAAQALPSPADADNEFPRWSQDGRVLHFLSDRPLPDTQAATGLARKQLWQVDAQGDEPRVLTHSAGEISAYSFDASGRQLAYLAADPLAASVKQALDAKQDARRVGESLQYSRVWLQSLPDGKARVLTPLGMQVHDVAWSPDGKRLAARISTGTTLNDYWYRSRVVLLDPRTGAVQATLEAHASAFPLQWSPDGKRLLYGRLGEHGMTAAPILHDLASKQARALGGDWPGTLYLLRWQDDGTLIGEGQRGVRGAFLQLDAGTGAWQELAQPQLPYQAFSVAANGRIAYLGTSATQPVEVWTLDHGQAAPRTDSNPQVAGWQHGQLRELSWKSSRDGRDITGLLLTPPGWKPGTPLPTLVQIHGGPAWAWTSGWQGSWHDWGQLLSTHGYAVFLPNPRGSEGQGAAFTELARNDWGGGDFQDILDGVDLLQAEGVIDPQRLAIGGWSYGGYMSAWAAGHSKRFKTAIVGAGVIDIGAMALTTDTPDYLPGYFGDPTTQREAYDRHSPIRYARDITVPVLILHGEQDKRVPLHQGQMLHGALQFTGTPVEMVVYPRGPHWFYEYEHERDVQERVLGWLQQHLR
jgi:dipeptidyl aminopeptidase/acylaminoacyl peptidase